MIDVVAQTLAYVKSVAIIEANKTQLLDFDTNKIRWVLTVPAIWTDVAKVITQFHHSLVLSFFGGISFTFHDFLCRAR